MEQDTRPDEGDQTSVAADGVEWLSYILVVGLI